MKDAVYRVCVLGLLVLLVILSFRTSPPTVLTDSPSAFEYQAYGVKNSELQGTLDGLARGNFEPVGISFWNDIDPQDTEFMLIVRKRKSEGW